MAEAILTTIYGIEIDVRCAALLRIVVENLHTNTTSSANACRQALEKLGKYGCAEALSYVASEAAKINTTHAANIRIAAIEYI